MNGLRIYINQKTFGAWLVEPIFYTRRAGGPYYRWRYEELLGRWLGSRMHSHDLPVTELVAAPWREVPTALKACIGEHYID